MDHMGLRCNASSPAAGRVDHGMRILFPAVSGRPSLGGLIGGLVLLLANVFTAHAATSRLTLPDGHFGNETGFRIERSIDGRRSR